MLINTIKGVGISIGLTMILLLIFAILLTYTNISEQWTQPVVIVLSGISILAGSSIVNSKQKNKGIIRGACVGLLYFVILYIISSSINLNFYINIPMIIMTFVGVVFGIIGGIIGINKK